VLNAEKLREPKTISMYLKEVKNLIRGDNLEAALRMLDNALTEHPFNALLLSYYGYLDTIVNKNYKRGMDLCKTAIEISKEELKEEGSFKHEGFHAVLYFHLGKTYLVGGVKQSAVRAFKQGLEADPENPYLLGEARRMGIRRKPVFPFLKRSNPINKYIGMLIHNK